MIRSRLKVLPLFLCVLLLFGCSGGSSMNPPPLQSAAVSVTITDMPPSSVAIVSFEVDVTGAMLNPGGPDLLAGKPPVQIEVKHLEVETAFISTASVQAGSGPFTSLSLTFANPELTFQNISPNPVTFGACVNVQPQGVCELKPTTTGLMANANLPAPLTIIANSPVGLNVDVNLMNLISDSLGVDFGTGGAVTVAQSQQKAEGELEDIDDLFGKVDNKQTDTFDLITSQDTIKGIKVDPAGVNTEFEDFDKAATPCAADPQNFTCVSNGQFVEVDLNLMPAGMLFAKKVELKNEANEDDLEGIVFAVDTATNTFQMVAIEDNSSFVPASVLGSPITISAPPLTTQFEIDSDGLNICGTCSFNDFSAMEVGQNVQVRLVTPVTGDGSSTTPFVVDRVRLRMSRFTATVSQAPSGSNFNVTPLPGTLLAAAGVGTIQVQASQAEFEPSNISVANLQVNDTVSLRGLLFEQPGTPVLIAGKVRKR